jgi:hypothetical protein
MKANWVTLCVLVGCLAFSSGIASQEITFAGLSELRAQQPNPQVDRASTDASHGEFVIAPTNIGNFQYGRNTYRIWASIYNNPDSPRLWQFRYDPLWKPEVRTDGSFNITQDDLFGGKVKITVPILFDSTIAKRLAFESIQRTYPDQAQSIQLDSVQVLPVRSITGLRLFGTGQDEGVNQMLVRKDLGFTGIPPQFTIALEVPDKNTANQLMKILTHVEIGYSMGFSAKTAKRTLNYISMKQLKNTRLFSRLNGLGTSTVYVHRNSLRALTENISREIHWDKVIEVPEQADNAVFLGFINDWARQVKVELTSFDTIKDSVYDKEDLKPNIITDKLNETFHWDEGHHTWKRTGEFKTSGGFDFFKIMGAEGELSGSVDDEGMKSFLKKNAIHAEIHGKIIEPKALDLQTVSMGDFDNETKVTSSTLYVSEYLDRSESGTLDMKNYSPFDPQDLPTRLAEIDKHIRDQLLVANTEIQTLVALETTKARALDGAKESMKRVSETYNKATGELNTSGASLGAFQGTFSQHLQGLHNLADLLSRFPVPLPNFVPGTGRFKENLDGVSKDFANGLFDFENRHKDLSNKYNSSLASFRSAEVGLKVAKLTLAEAEKELAEAKTRREAQESYIKELETQLKFVTGQP